MREGMSQAIFGSFDGLSCVLGVIAAGYIAGDFHALALSAVGLALAEGIAMAGGSYLSDVTSVNSLRHAGIIGGAAFVGVLLPALPFLVAPRQIALALSILLTIALAVLIAQVRAPTGGRIRAYAQTFAILVVAAFASIAVSLALNGAG